MSLLDYAPAYRLEFVRPGGRTRPSAFAAASWLEACHVARHESAIAAVSAGFLPSRVYGVELPRPQYVLEVRAGSKWYTSAYQDSSSTSWGAAVHSWNVAARASRLTYRVRQAL